MHIAEPVMVLEPLHLDLMQLTRSTCKWPLGDGPYTYCGHPTVEGKPYCPGHVAIAYTPLPPRTRVPYPMRRAA
jgi:hypothetical protein